MTAQVFRYAKGGLGHQPVYLYGLSAMPFAIVNLSGKTSQTSLKGKTSTIPAHCTISEPAPANNVVRNELSNERLAKIRTLCTIGCDARWRESRGQVKVGVELNSTYG
jgi:hypothetical protein